MYKILFVCHGNICRSPMAEFLMKRLVEQKGVSDKFHIESAATSCEEIGNPVYPPTKRILEKYGIDCSKKRARRINKSDGEKFDYIICMDSRNLTNIERLLPPDAMKKVSRLLDFADNPRDVADPWYTGDFKSTERDVLEGTQGLYNHITKN